MVVVTFIKDGLVIGKSFLHVVGESVGGILVEVLKAILGEMVFKRARTFPLSLKPLEGTFILDKLVID